MNPIPNPTDLMTGTSAASLGEPGARARRSSIRVSLQSKLLGAFGVVVALMLAVGLFAVDRLGSDSRQLTHLADQVVPSTRTVGDINALMNKYRKDQLHYIVAVPADRPGASGIDGDLAGDLALMEQLLGSYRTGLVSDATDRHLLDAFSHDFARYVSITASFRALADRGRILIAGEVVGDGAGDAEYNVLKVVIAQWLDHKVTTANAAAQASRSSNHRGVMLILLLLGIAVMIALGVAMVLARRITRAVRAIGRAAEAIAQGEIVERVAVSSHDELGDMADDFDSMVDYLTDTVAVAETIAAGDLEVPVHPRSERDALGTALAAMTESLRGLIGENERLLAASREEANTDALTGLPNRRALMNDLDACAGRLGEGEPLVLALFDLDGFKQYNDTFGHPAGDALLVRLADRLRAELGDRARAYRMGGDEFCMLATAVGNGGHQLARSAADAMCERGAVFSIGCSYGLADLPADAVSAEDALRIADHRMYDHKAGRASASRQSIDVLLEALNERSPGLHDHVDGVADLAVATAHRLGIPQHEVKRIEIAAQLHDIGKVAIPDSILNKPGPLDEEEWSFMHRHTLIGERIVLAAPSLAPAAELVRSSHERHDGRGYPDHLHGPEIPLGASIVCACDAYDAMISDRPYSQAKTVEAALEELQRCAGTQFRPEVVGALCDVVREQYAKAAEAA